MTWGGKAPRAQGGDWHIWGSGGSLGDGGWGAGAEEGSLIASKINSHHCMGCPWEENWTKDPCPHSGLECVWLILGKLSEKHTNPRKELPCRPEDSLCSKDGTTLPKTGAAAAPCKPV